MEAFKDLLVPLALVHKKKADDDAIVTMNDPRETSSSSDSSPCTLGSDINLNDDHFNAY